MGMAALGNRLDIESNRSHVVPVRRFNCRGVGHDDDVVLVLAHADSPLACSTPMI